MQQTPGKGCQLEMLENMKEKPSVSWEKWLMRYDLHTCQNGCCHDRCLSMSPGPSHTPGPLHTLKTSPGFLGPPHAASLLRRALAVIVHTVSFLLLLSTVCVFETEACLGNHLELDCVFLSTHQALSLAEL